MDESVFSKVSGVDIIFVGGVDHREIGKGEEDRENDGANHTNDGRGDDPVLVGGPYSPDFSLGVAHHQVVLLQCFSDSGTVGCENSR